MANSLQGIRQFRDSLSPKQYHPQARLGTDYVHPKSTPLVDITVPARHLPLAARSGLSRASGPRLARIALEPEILGKFPR
jgi:hypothetical protein